MGILTYVAPFLIANGVTLYTLSKINERRIIAKFNNAETIHDIKPDVTQFEETRVVLEEIKDLVHTIEKNIAPEYLYNLYRNLNNAKIRQNFLLLLAGIKGKYSNRKNTLNYTFKGTLAHEFLHLASVYYDKENNICKSGFIHYDKGFNLGRALNEGYTDLTARRLFNKRTMFYDGEVRLVQFFELLFGKEEFRKYYFTNDLISVINRLSTFVEREEAIKLLIKFDLGYDLKMLSNPAYKIIYTELELKLSEIFMKSKKPFSKQFDHLHLLEKSPITSVVKKVKVLS